MEQYLLELIKNNNRVIVPNFGAFIVSRDAGTTVLFNNFLSFNDGLLINHISKKESLDANDATQKVSDYVDKAKKELDEKGEYSIENLGSFTKDQNGILRFTQDPHLTELLPDTETDKKEEDDSGLLDIDNEPSSGDDLKNGKEETSTSSAGKDTKLLNLDEKSGEEKPAIKKASSADTTTSKAEVPQSETSVYDNARKKSAILLWVITLIIIIAAIFVLLYFFSWQDNDKAVIPEAIETEVVDTVKEEPAVDSLAIKKAEEERLQKEQEEKEAQEREVAANAKVRKHHIIVGSFKSEANAQKLVKSLKSRGFDQAFSFTHNNLYMVSAASYESLLEARQAQEKILQEQRLENWILTKK